MRTTAIAMLFPLLSSCLVAACSGASPTAPNDEAGNPSAPTANSQLQAFAVARRAPPVRASARLAPAPAPRITGGSLLPWSIAATPGSAITGGRLAPRVLSDPPSTCQLPQERPDGPSTWAPWRLETIDTALHPAAVCNDGSPAVYMIRRNPATTRWLVWIEGGGTCVDGPSCEQRWQEKRDLMSSVPIRDRYAAGTLGFPSSGVFSVDPVENPALHDANLVQVQYCSSDVWSGDHAGDPGLPLGDVARWHFKGRAIALAAIDELLAREDFGSATEITFGGGSAGSAGIYNTIDELRERAPATARVIGLSDGGYQIAYPAYDPVTQMESTVTPTPVEQIGLLGQRNWGGRGDASCDAAATSDTERLDCRSAEVLTRHGHITTPLLIINNQYDFNQTARLGIDISRNTGIVADAPQAAFVRRFATRMREQLALSDALHSIFASYDVLHVTSQSDKSLSMAINGKLERDAIADWHRDPCAPMRRIEAEIPGKPAIAGP